jgi:hypothetical protein
MSNADKRSVATDALATLGTILDEHQKRDAIHLAVEPVIAGERLQRFDHIVIRDGKAYAADIGAGLGIVDPFLAKPVEQGQRFWFVMYPRMITSLRHVWAHPAFPDEPGTPAPVQVAPTSNKSASEEWLREYATRFNVYYDPETAYLTMMAEIAEGQGLVRHGNDMSGLGDLEDSDELRRHASIVLGKEVDWSTFEYFSCSC